MENYSKEEYELLRNELTDWQNRRFSIVGVTVSIFSAVLGFSSITGFGGTWDLISSMLLFLLIIACWFTAYCGKANVKISTYLRTFQEGKGSVFKWESRLDLFSALSSTKTSSGNLNKHISTLYLFLAVLSVLIPPMIFKNPGEPVFAILFVLAMASVFVYTLVHLYNSQNGKDHYMEVWAKVKSSEEISNNDQA